MPQVLSLRRGGSKHSDRSYEQVGVARSGFGPPVKSSSLDALKYLMDVQQVKQSELPKALGVGASAVSMILSGARPITADHSRKLGKHLALSPAAFR